jgi:hypothetical protein
MNEFPADFGLVHLRNEKLKELRQIIFDTCTKCNETALSHTVIDVSNYGRMIIKSILDELVIKFEVVGTLSTKKIDISSTQLVDGQSIVNVNLHTTSIFKINQYSVSSTFLPSTISYIIIPLNYFAQGDMCSTNCCLRTKCS